ncbi:hypothetical protein [Clostridium intestinale]|nr:hypothetical protein [Clostridium intestinale]WRY49502.1 hypothetical protein P8F83_12275 [Clostridium intestinale]
MEQVVKIISLFWVAIVLAAIAEVIRVDVELIKKEREEDFDYK